MSGERVLKINNYFPWLEVELKHHKYNIIRDGVCRYVRYRTEARLNTLTFSFVRYRTYVMLCLRCFATIP